MAANVPKGTRVLLRSLPDKQLYLLLMVAQSPPSLQSQAGEIQEWVVVGGEPNMGSMAEKHRYNWAGAFQKQGVASCVRAAGEGEAGCD